MSAVARFDLTSVLLIVFVVASNDVQVNAADNATPLDVEQEAILREFRRFEENLLKSAESTRRIDPNRAELLQRARGLSVEKRIAAEMERVAKMLGGESARFGAAKDEQAELIASMESLLKLLQSENERDRLEEERARIEELLKQTNKLIAKQRDVRADTGRGQSTDQLQDKQQELADETGELAQKIDAQDKARNGEKSEPNEGDPKDGDNSDTESPDGQKSDGEKADGQESDGQKSDSEKPDSDPKEGDRKEGDNSDGDPKEGEPKSSDSDGQQPKDGQKSDSQQQSGDPQSQQQQGSQSQQQQGSQQQGDQQNNQQQQQQTPGREELENARQQMQQAIEELEKKQRESAGEAQDEAVAELERLKAKLEEILRQLREEEEEILLTLLEARFQQMLQLQLRVNAATVRLDKTPEEDRSGPFLTNATQLSRDQGDILLEATKALRLLQEEGSSAAFPEAVSQMCDSMRQVERRLQGADVGKTTQLIEEMIVEALEEMIVALQKELDEKQKDQQSQQGQQQQGDQEQSLVDQLAELKMIRSLQAAVNRMTEQFDNELQSRPDRTPSGDDREFLLDLARRQQRIQKITYELATKRTD